MPDKIFWVDVNGIELPLTDNVNFQVLRGMSGRFMPPISFVEEEIPFQSGSKLREVLIKPREVDLPIFIKEKDEVSLRKRIRAIMRAFNPIKGDGKLKVISPNGETRELYCRYSGGLEITESKETKGFNWQTLVLILKAFDPYWYDSSTMSQTFRMGTPAPFFPIPPLRLSSGSVFAQINVDNTGDVETWPEWNVYGPGSNLILKNISTGEVTNLTVDLGPGEYLTIDTKPYHKTILKNGVTNLYHGLSDDSSLWSLKEGINSIQFDLFGANEQSSVQLNYRNRYWGP